MITVLYLRVICGRETYPYHNRHKTISASPLFSTGSLNKLFIYFWQGRGAAGIKHILRHVVIQRDVHYWECDLEDYTLQCAAR